MTDFEYVGPFTTYRCWKKVAGTTGTTGGFTRAFHQLLEVGRSLTRFSPVSRGQGPAGDRRLG